MTISERDWGRDNSGKFCDEPDTVAIVYHQLAPAVNAERDDLGERIGLLIRSAPEMLAELKRLRDKAYNEAYSECLWERGHSRDESARIAKQTVAHTDTVIFRAENKFEILPSDCS